MEYLEPHTQKNIKEWLEGPYDEETKKYIEKLLQEDPKQLSPAFFQKLSFGTGGARGIMGIGTNRINKYTIRSAAQGLANYLNQKVKNPKVVIGYDNRNNSQFFAEQTAQVLAANNIKAYLFEELRPTPLISFACREKKASAAVMITASHNPPEYNGFKVYWEDGGQVLPPHDKGIISEVNKIKDPRQVKIANINHPLIERILHHIDEQYLKNLLSLPFLKKKGSKIKIVYTNLHGTGITLIPKALSLLDFHDLILVKEQKTIDGNFPYAPLPNPEEKSTLKLGIDLLMQKNGDIFIATDPDADRIAIVVNHHKLPIILTGNQIACILLVYICENMEKLPKKGACIKSIVTTELFKAIAHSYDIACLDVLTGFKYISQKIKNWEKENSYQFILGAEESYGYLAETFARDKDAISTACIIAKIASLSKTENRTLIDLLTDIYAKYGIYREKVGSIKFAEDEMEKMESIMKKLRDNPPSKLADIEIIQIEDYYQGKVLDLKTSQSSSLNLPSSNVLLFRLADESKVVIRPSGTEPKMKIYAFTKETHFTSISEGIKKCDHKLDILLTATKENLF